MTIKSVDKLSLKNKQTIDYNILWLKHDFKNRIEIEVNLILKFYIYTFLLLIYNLF